MSDDPYQVPEADLQPEAPDPDGFHLPVARRAGRGSDWFFGGWQLFTRNPLMLIVLSFILLILLGLVGMVPFLGGIAVALFWPHLFAGLYLALEHADNGQPVALGDLFEPFNRPGHLLGIGGLTLAAQIVMMLVSMVFVMAGTGVTGIWSSLAQPGLQMHSHTGEMLLLWSLLAALIALALSIPLAMATLFAPILSFRYNLAPVKAMKLSFLGCWRNMLPFFVWSLIWLVAFIALALVFLVPFLGWVIGIAGFVVLLPLTLANIYRAWRDIYLS